MFFVSFRSSVSFSFFAFSLSHTLSLSPMRLRCIRCPLYCIHTSFMLLALLSVQFLFLLSFSCLLLQAIYAHMYIEHTPKLSPLYMNRMNTMQQLRYQIITSVSKITWKMNGTRISDIVAQRFFHSNRFWWLKRSSLGHWGECTRFCCFFGKLSRFFFKIGRFLTILYIFSSIKWWKFKLRAYGDWMKLEFGAWEAIPPPKVAQWNH